MSEIRVDTISEKTSASGVTIDGLTIKDGNIIGDVALAGTTPTFTIGDAGAEDASLIFDGNAQDFYIALDDSADDLVIGTGSTVGSNVKMVIENGGNIGIGTASPDASLHITSNTPVIAFDESDVSQQYRIGSFGGAFSIYDATNSVYRFVMNNSGSIGIGETAPLGKFHVKSADSGMGSVNANADELVIEGSGNSGLTILSGASSKSNIFFGDSGSNAIGDIGYDHSSNALNIGVGGAERMRIDSSGNVGIGTTSPSGSGWASTARTLHIYQNNTVGSLLKLESSNTIGVLNASDNAFQIATQTDDPIKIYTNSAERMRIHSSGMTELKVPDSANTLQLTPSGTNANGTINFNSPGSGGAIFKVANTETMRIHSIGAVTMPHQPAFHVHPASEQTNFNQGQTVGIVFGTERFDNNGDFASNTFTAPVTGRYHFDVSIRIKNMSTEDSATYYYWILTTSNRSYYNLSSVNELGSGSASFTFSGSALVDMDASDTASVSIIMGGTSGSSPSDISVDSYWSGHLVC